MVQPRKKHKTLAERNQLRAEQALARRNAPAKIPKKKAGGRQTKPKHQPATSTDQMPMLAELVDQIIHRREPAPPPIRDCQTFFWQQLMGGPIQIGTFPPGEDNELREMRGAGPTRAHRLAVIRYDLTDHLPSIQQSLAEFEIEPGSGFYHPAPAVIDHINRTIAEEWEPSRRVSIPLVEKECPRCTASFKTRENDRYYKDCTKEVKKAMLEDGALTPYPRRTMIKLDNYGAHYEGDPSPSQENAVKLLEGD